MLPPPEDEESQVSLGPHDAAGRLGGGPQRSPPQQEQGGRDGLDQQTNEYLKAPGREPQPEIRTDPQQAPQPMTQAVAKHGFLTVRPKITATCSLTGFQSIAQPILTTFEQAAPSYKSLQSLFKNRSDNIVRSPSPLPAGEVVKHVVVEVLSVRVVTEVLGE